MKKLMLIMAVAMVCSMSCKAQEGILKGKEIKWGVKGGLNVSTIKDGGQYIDSDQRKSYYLGVFGVAKLNADCELEINLAYSRQGVKMRTYNLDTDENYNETYNLDYLKLSPIMKCHVISDFYLLFGGYFSSLIDCHKYLDDLDHTDIDYGLILGASISLSKNIALETKYNIGLQEFDDCYDATNRLFQFGLSYEF